MPNIVVSYRREDSQWIAGRVFDHLEAHYGKSNVFMDIDSIPFGLDFREHIQNTLNKCDILVAVIGPRWLEANEGGQARIQEDTDWVRIEIEAALNRKIPVIPVLIDRARMPKPVDLPPSIQNFAYRQAADVDTGRDFRAHMDRLIRSMDGLLNHQPPPQPPITPPLASAPPAERAELALPEAATPPPPPPPPIVVETPVRSPSVQPLDTAALAPASNPQPLADVTASDFEVKSRSAGSAVLGFAALGLLCMGALLTFAGIRSFDRIGTLAVVGVVFLVLAAYMTWLMLRRPKA